MTDLPRAAPRLIAIYLFLDAGLTTRADRKSQVRQCLGSCPDGFWSSLAYESPEQKPKPCLT